MPVPADLLVLAAGAAAARGDVDPLPVLLTIIAAGLIGGVLQYLLARSAGRGLLLAVLDRFGVRRERVEQQAERLRRGGARGVALARMTPGVRVVAVAASGVARVTLTSFVAGLAIGNTVFVSAHFGLGFLVGDSALRAVSAAAGPLALAGLALALVGAAAWWWLGAGRGSGRVPAVAGREAFAEWADAACPACLTVVALGSLDRAPAEARPPKR